jgi:hypothetical protein
MNAFSQTVRLLLSQNLQIRHSNAQTQKPSSFGTYNKDSHGKPYIGQLCE